MDDVCDSEATILPPEAKLVDGFHHGNIINCIPKIHC